MLSRFGSFDEIDTSQQFIFDIEDKPQFLHVTPLQDGRGLDWLMVVVIPKADFTAQIDTNTRNTIILSFVALLVAMVSGLITSSWITAPIVRVSQASDKLAQGELEQQVEPSIIIEINTLANSFNKMAAQLKESFDALCQSEITNRAIVNTIPDLMIRARSDGTYLDIIDSHHSQSIYELKKFKAGSTVEESLPSELAQKQMRYIQQALATGKLQIYEHQIRLNGQLRDEEVRILVLGEEEVLIMVRDISARKQAEKALEQANQALERKVAERTASLAESQRTLATLMSNLPGMAYRCLNDSDLTMVFVSEGCRSLTGYLSEDLIHSNLVTYNQLIHSQDQDRVWQQIDQALSEKRPFQLIYRLFTQQGTEKWVWEQGQGIFNSEGKLELIEGFITDISDRIKAEQALKQSNQELRSTLQQLEITQLELQRAKEKAEAANRAKSTFIAHMSHELRTPLNGILGFTQILQQDPHLTSKQLDGIKTIQQCGSHLLTLIGDILDLAKIEAEKLELESSEWYFSDLLESVIAIIRLKAENKGIGFNYQPQSSLPILVRGDQKRLRQVLLNLLSNAVKFTETGSVTFKVGYVEDKEDKEEISQSPITNPQSPVTKIRFQVEDTGIGIPSEKLADIFVPFQQAVEGQFAQEGTGLGLTISQNIIQQMGGEIKVESTLGQGSIFWFEVNLPEVESSHQSKQTNSKPRIVGFKGQAAPILVVDDKIENRVVIVKFLSPLGFEVIEAANGEEGLAKARQYQPSLIIMDLVMPVLDGFEASRRLRQEPNLQEVAIVATSASIFPQDKCLSYQAGCDAFLPKPIDLGRLLETIAIHLKVEWIYEQINPTTPPGEKTITVERDLEEDVSSSPIVAPPEEELSILLDLAKQGNIARILQRAAKIEQLAPQYLPFATTLRQLAEGFQEKKLQQFIQDHIR